MSFVQAAPTKPRALTWDFNLTFPPRALFALLAVGLVAYIGLWFTGWQALVPVPALRVLIAFGLWLFPGWVIQQLVWHGDDVTTSQRLTQSFALAVALAACAGLLATVLHLSLNFVVGILAGVGSLGAIGLAARRNWDLRRAFSVHLAGHLTPAHVWMVLPFALTCLLVISLTSRLAMLGDDLSFNAYIVNWQYGERFDWNQVFFDLPGLATSRFWVAYWTLSEALIARTGGIHAYQLVQSYFSPLLALTALGAAYALARAFGQSRAVSSFVVTAQAAGLLLLTKNDQAGINFFNRLAEDKVVAFFILLPALVIAATSFSKQSTVARLWLLLGAALALLFTHPTVTGVGIGSVGLLALVNFLFTRQGRPLVGTWLVLGLGLAALVAVRSLDSGYLSKLAFDVDEEIMRGAQLHRVIEWTDALAGMNPRILFEIPYVGLAVAALLALAQLKSNLMARWILVTTLVIISVIVPFTAWGWSRAMPIAQLYRVAWIAPFGLGAALIVTMLWNWLVSRTRRRPILGVQVVFPSIALLLLVAASGSLLVNPERNNLEAFHLSKNGQRDYTDLIALRPIVDAQLSQPAVFVGGDKWLNERMPSLTVNLRVFMFRSVLNMWRLGGLSREDAQARTKAWRTLTDKKTPTAQRLEILRTYNVAYIISNQGTAWVDGLVREEPQRIQLISQQGKLQLYRFEP